MFKLNEFVISPQQTWANSFPWGGGHTLETDPTRRGWRIRAVDADLAVVGRSGNPGCLSVRSSAEGYDVAFYECTPLELANDLKRPVGAREIFACAYRHVGNASGWALPFIQEIETFASGSVGM